MKPTFLHVVTNIWHIYVGNEKIKNRTVTFVRIGRSHREKNITFWDFSQIRMWAPQPNFFGHLNILLMGAKINVHFHNYEPF